MDFSNSKRLHYECKSSDSRSEWPWWTEVRAKTPSGRASERGRPEVDGMRARANESVGKVGTANRKGHAQHECFIGFSRIVAVSDELFLESGKGNQSPEL